MEETPEIRKLEDGRYSFVVGRERYTLATSLDEESFFRVVKTAQEAVKDFPPTLKQEDRLFLALLALSNKIDEVACRIDDLLTLAEETEKGLN
ncbi:MAG: hypothetical protein Q4F74_02705 [Synergistaceae bacterium]|nr:hypothetical protein [Synergistaceae bacterium]